MSEERQVTVQEVADGIINELLNMEVQLAGVSAQVGMITGSISKLKDRYIQLTKQLFEKLHELAQEEDQTVPQSAE